MHAADRSPHEHRWDDTFRAVFERSLDALLLADDDGRYLDANPAATRLLGRSRNDLLGASIADVSAGDVAAAELWREFLAAGELAGAYTIRRPDGTTVEVEYRATANVRPGVHLSAMRDVTPLRRAERALREAEEEARQLLESVSDGFTALDRSWRFTYVNKAAEAHLGRPRDELLGHVLWELYPETVGTDFERQYRQVMETGEPAAFEAYSAAPFHTWYRERVYPTAGGIAIFTVDVGEQRRWEQHLRQTEKLQALGQLAGGIAHDFNNLLTGVTGFAELAERYVRDDEDPIPLLEEIQQLAERGGALVRDLLAFSRRQERDPRPLSLGSVLEGLRPLLARVLSERIRLRIDAADDLHPVQADRSQLEQVVINLAVNAEDALPRGGELHIRARNVAPSDAHSGARNVAPSDAHSGARNVAPPDAQTADPAGWIELTVADTGVGMDTDTLERAFEPFFSTKPEGKGSGLGLASVHGIVQATGGHISVDTAPGQGTTFRLLLPAATVAEPAAEPRRRDDPPATTPRRVLLVEDEPTIRELVTETLQHAGHVVFAAADADEARRLFDGHHAELDAVITDVVLPGTSGPQLLEQLRALNARLPVLLISGYAADNLDLGALDGRHTAFLPKPFGMADLLHNLGQLLDGTAPE